MIYEYKKYKGIKEFFANEPISNLKRSFTIVNKCKCCTLSDDKFLINDNCFGCLFCCVSSEELRDQVFELYGKEFVEDAAENGFKGSPIKPKIIQKGVRHPYCSLEKFTAVDETTNIQPWVAGILSELSYPKSRIGMEVPVFNYDYDRNGRLDVCVHVNNKLLVIESKTTLEDALSDERFIVQHSKYTQVIDSITNNYIYLTLIGGKETDLFPIDSSYCTGKIGEISYRFHKILVENNIKIISAKAIWVLCCKYMQYGDAYSWDKFLLKVFQDPTCIGLLSAGKLVYKNNKFQIETIQ